MKLIEHLSRRAVVRALRLPKDEGGAVMTEFIIVAPFFCFLVVGTIQIMGLAHADALLQYANFMAARAGSVHYERIRTDDYRHDLGREMNASQMQKLRDVMEDAAEFAMGPLHAPLAEFRELGNAGILETTPIYSSPVDVFEITVYPGEIRLDPNTYKHNHRWITSRSEAKIAMGYAFVGNAIQAVHLEANPIDVEDTQEFAERSFDVFGTTPDFVAQVQAAIMKHRGMPYIVTSSDAFMDTRQNDGEDKELRWPFSATGGSYKELRGGSFSNQTLETGPADPQPIALPIWDRHRFSD